MSANPRELVQNQFTAKVEEALYQALSQACIMLYPGADVLLAFSGGPDSTAMLAALLAISKQRGFEVQACHINHRLRGDEADADEDFCRQICEKWNVPLHIERAAEPACLHEVSENELREFRYAKLTEIAERTHSAVCLTGHTLDDQVETMLFRLFRGTGPSGLLGIRPYRKLTPKLTLIRPLLQLRRSDCFNFLSALGIEPRIDSSNADPLYSRNYIRKQIIPLIEQRFGSFAERMENFRQLLEGDEALLRCMSDDAVCELRDPAEQANRHLQTDAYSWNVDQFNELPLSLRRRVLHQTLRELGTEHDFDRIESLLEIIDADGTGAISLDEEWEMRVFRGEIIWRRRNQFDECAEEDDSSEEHAEAGKVPGNICSSNLKEGTNLLLRLGLSMRIERIDLPRAEICFPPACELEVVVDLSNIGQLEALQFRQRQPGDHIQPLGMANTVRLKKYLHTHKSTKTLSFRGKALVLSNDSEVLWVPGCGLSQRIAVQERATHRLIINKIAPDKLTYC